MTWQGSGAASSREPSSQVSRPRFPRPRYPRLPRRLKLRPRPHVPTPAGTRRSNGRRAARMTRPSSLSLLSSGLACFVHVRHICKKVGLACMSSLYAACLHVCCHLYVPCLHSTAPHTVNPVTCRPCHTPCHMVAMWRWAHGCEQGEPAVESCPSRRRACKQRTGS